MPKDITKFVRKHSRETVTREHFFKLADQCKNKFELRALEQSLLKPKPLPPYIGPAKGRTDFKKKSLNLTFPNEQYIQRWMKFLRINQFKEYNTWDVDIFVLLLEHLESGRLSFNSKDRALILNKVNKKRIVI
jgi:hypothetical protein